MSVCPNAEALAIIKRQGRIAFIGIWDYKTKQRSKIEGSKHGRIFYI